MAGMVPPRRRRDRRGRGLRGLLVPHGTGTAALDHRWQVPAPVPLARTRSERFDDLVLDAVEHLEQRWADALDGVEFAVEEVPPRVEESGGPDDWLDEPVPLARLYQPSGPGAQAETPRIVLYRKPIEARSFDEADKADLVLDVVIHEVADLLGVTPAVVDPEGHSDLDG